MKKLKKVIGILMALITCCTCFSFVGCAKNAGLRIKGDSAVRMNKYETTTLSVIYDGQVEWNCSNDKVAVITANGKSVDVLAIGVGEATISAKAGNSSVGFKLTVYPVEQEIELSLLSANQTLLVVGEESQIKTQLSFDGTNIENSKTHYSIVSQSPVGCISVDQNGKLTAQSKGTALIKVWDEYYGNLSNEVFVTAISLPQEELVLDKTVVNLFSDARYPTTAEVSAKIYADGDVLDAGTLQAESSDQTVAIFENGMIKAVGVGQATLTFTCESNGRIIESNLFVSIKERPAIDFMLNVTSVSINNKKLDGLYNNTAKLSAMANVEGEIVENAEVEYSIKSGEGIINLSQTGVITGLNKGTAVVTATYVDSYGVSHNSDCTVNVGGPVYYGTHANYNHNGIVAEFDKISDTELSTIAIKNVTLANDKNTELVKFQYIPDARAIGNTDAIGPRQIQIVIQDADNLNNYIWVSVVRTANNSTRSGVRASTMGGYSNTYYGTTDSKYTSSDKLANSSSGWAVSGLPLIFNGAGLSSTDYEKYMIGVSIQGTTVYLSYNGSVNKIWDLNADTVGYAQAGIDNTLLESMAWGGFNSNKVNIYIRGDQYNSKTIGYVSIDKIAGQKTTVAIVKDIEYVITNEKALPVPAK